MRNKNGCTDLLLRTRSRGGERGCSEKASEPTFGRRYDSEKPVACSSFVSEPFPLARRNTEAQLTALPHLRKRIFTRNIESSLILWKQSRSRVTGGDRYAEIVVPANADDRFGVRV